MMALSRFVDRSKTVGVVKLPHDLSALSMDREMDKDTAAVQNYCYDPAATNFQFAIPICPSTLRPYILDRRTRLPWLTNSENVYGPIKRQVSSFNYFIAYVEGHDAYPTMEEFIKYMAVKEASREDGQAKDTLPAQIVQMVEEVFSSYEKVLGPGFSYVTPQEFKRTTRASMCPKRREILESQGTRGREAVDYKTATTDAYGATSKAAGTTSTTTGVSGGVMESNVRDDGKKEMVDDNKAREAINVLASYAIDKTVDYLMCIKKKLSK
jgi:hypothetical protein